jgi:hypothetical protein
VAFTLLLVVLLSLALKSQLDINTKHTLVSSQHCLSLGRGLRTTATPIITMYNWVTPLCDFAPPGPHTSSCARTSDCARRVATPLCPLGCAFLAFESVFSFLFFDALPKASCFSDFRFLFSFVSSCVREPHTRPQGEFVARISSLSCFVCVLFQ